MHIRDKIVLSVAVVWLTGISVLGEEKPEKEKPEKEVLKQVFQYLHLYWGARKYSENYQRFFLGQKPKVNFVTQAAMLELLQQLCTQNKIHCNPHPESVMGKNLPDGRIVIVHALVHPLFEALHVVHELEHDKDDPEKSSAENEIRARMIERDFLRVLFGDRWLNQTKSILTLHSAAFYIGDYVYRDPTENAIRFLAKRFQELGVDFEFNELHKATLRNSVMFLVNDRSTLMHPYFVWAFKTK